MNERESFEKAIATGVLSHQTAQEWAQVKELAARAFPFRWLAVKHPERDETFAALCWSKEQGGSLFDRGRPQERAKKLERLESVTISNGLDYVMEIRSVFFMAIHRGHAGLAEKMARKWPNEARAELGLRGEGAMHWAAERASAKTIEALARAGFPAGNEDMNGETPLIALAGRSRHVNPESRAEALRALASCLPAGEIDKKVLVSGWETASSVLDLAARQGQGAFAAALIAAGADYSQKDEQGRSLEQQSQEYRSMAEIGPAIAARRESAEATKTAQKNASNSIRPRVAR